MATEKNLDINSLIEQGLLDKSEALEKEVLCVNRCNYNFHPVEVVTKQHGDDTTSELVSQGCLFCTVCAATKTIQFDAEFKLPSNTGQN